MKAQTLAPQAEESTQSGPGAFKFYAYLCSGEVIEIFPSTSVRLTPDDVEFMFGDILVTRIARRDIFYTDRRPDAMPVF